MKTSKCVLCARKGVEITEHHLVPKSTHKRFCGTFTKTEMNCKIDTCKQCHKQIHALLTELQCARDYNTIEKLLGHPGMQKFVSWVKKQRPNKRVITRKCKK